MCTVENADKMADEQVHSPSMCQTITMTMFQQLQSDLCVDAATEQRPHRPSHSVLDVFADDADEDLQVE